MTSFMLWVFEDIINVKFILTAATDSHGIVNRSQLLCIATITVNV